MPNLTIGGTKFNRVNNAKVEVYHGTAAEAKQIPVHQFTIELPLDNTTTLAEWALAPQGPARWKTVKLEITDRSKVVNHTWTLHKAYCHTYEELDYAPGSGSNTDQGNHVRIVVRGTLIHANTDYDGKNILEVKAGEAEAVPA